MKLKKAQASVQECHCVSRPRFTGFRSLNILFCPMFPFLNGDNNLTEASFLSPLKVSTSDLVVWILVCLLLTALSSCQLYLSHISTPMSARPGGAGLCAVRLHALTASFGAVFSPHGVCSFWKWWFLSHVAGQAIYVLITIETCRYITWSNRFHIVSARRHRKMQIRDERRLVKMDSLFFMAPVPIALQATHAPFWPQPRALPSVLSPQVMLWSPCCGVEAAALSSPACKHCPIPLLAA